MRIDLLCPSRGRPDRFRKLFQSAKDTASSPDRVSVYLALDWDDSQRAAYLQHDLNWPTADLCVTSYFGNAVRAWNALYRMSSGEIVMMAADDVHFVSKGWDTIFEETLKSDPLQILHYRDDFRNELRVCNPVTTRFLLQSIGARHYIPLDYVHMYADEHFEDIGRRAGCLKYLPEVHIPQSHPKVGTASWDATYERVRSEGYVQRGKNVFDSQAEMRQTAADRIKLLRSAR